MHRKVKGLLSVILTFAMVTATVAPVSADELSGGQQPAETQPVIEMAEEGAPVEQDAVQEPVAEEELVEQDAVQEPAAEEEPVGQDAVQEPAVEGELTAADIDSVVEQLMMESNRTPAEQAAAEIALASIYGDTDFNYLYGELTADQKKFRVFAGTDIHSESTFLDDGVVPDNENSQNNAITNLRKSRDFYTLLGWKLWKVGSNGEPESTLETESTTLNKVATESNFKQAVYLENNGTGTDPKVLCQQPILEPILEAYTYRIPAYDTNENFVEYIEINVENYTTSSFPEMEGVYWKMIYDGTECRLDAASEIWTNDTNGIGKIGFIKFEASEAKLLAYIDDSISEEPQYVIAGEQGNNGWYKSDVIISAKDGYAVRLSETDEWANAVSVTESGAVTLYIKVASGAELPAQTLNFAIDKTAPVISGVENGQTYYSNEVQVVVTDEHLQTVTKNGGDVGVNDNTAYIALNPSEESYTISAEDAAGNQTIYIVSVKQAGKQEGTAEFIQPGWRVGEEKPAPVVSSITNGVENITYYYKEQGAEDSAYTTTVPSEAGKYTAKAVFAETELFNEVSVTSNFEILPSAQEDGTAPVISGVENGQTYYGDQKVTITDENLSSVTVNGSAVEVSGNSVDITLIPSDGAYSIVAEDTAGNRTQYTVEVLETWIRDGITTNGKKNLKSARMYKLGGGKWTVAGDNTVYAGGGSFYVKNGGEYDFKKK
ncbi:MAG: hypothetical protein K2N89_02540 [Lachnospiraceae bacterium]|nr:hypothetical protein [Lachnospiraceae bacterium]